MPPIAHPGRLLKREMQARNLSADRLALDIGAPSGRVTDILAGRRSVTAETAARLVCGNAGPSTRGRAAPVPPAASRRRRRRLV